MDLDVLKVNGDILLIICNMMARIQTYFSINEITKEKIDLMEKGIKLNLSLIRNKINRTIN